MADPVLKITGDTEKAQQSIVALEKRIDKLQNSLKHLSEQSRKAGKAGEQSFGAQSLSQVANYAAGFVTLTAAVNVANQALKYHNDLRNEAGKNNRDAVPGLSQLSQFAAERQNPTEALQKLTQMSQRAFEAGVGKSLDEAASFIFSMESAGVQGPDRAILQQLAGNKTIGDPAGFVESLKALLVAVGQAETGSLRDIASKAFSASSFAAAPADALLSAASAAGPGAAALRIRDEELLSAIAITSNATSASEAGTQLKSLFQSLQNKGGFAGVPLQEAVSQISAQGMSDAELNKFFGSSEAAMAFRLLNQNMGDYTTALTKIETAAQSDVSSVVANLPLTLPQISASLAASQAEARLESSRIDIGTINELANSMHSELVRSAENGYGSGYFENVMAYTGRFFQGDSLSVCIYIGRIR